MLRSDFESAEDIFATLMPPNLVSDVLDDILSCRLVITSNTSLTRFGGISVAKMSAALLQPIRFHRRSRPRNLSSVSAGCLSSSGLPDMDSRTRHRCGSKRESWFLRVLWSFLEDAPMSVSMVSARCTTYTATSMPLNLKGCRI